MSLVLQTSWPPNLVSQSAELAMTQKDSISNNSQNVQELLTPIFSACFALLSV